MLMRLRSIYYWVPEDIRQGLLVRRRSPLWRRTGILFIHIPKAAGTSINQAVFGRFMGHARASDVERWGSAEVKALPSFAVTRNPWDRLVSAYRFALRGRGVGGVQQAWVWRPEQYRVPEFESFDTFVKDWLAPRTIAKLDPIFQPQSLFTCDRDGALLLDHVGRLDNIEPTLDFIAATIGRRPEILEGNRSGERVDYRSFYTADLADIVASIYDEDVRRFRYSFE